MCWRTIRDVTALSGGLGVLFHQVVITNQPSLGVLLLGVGLVGLPSTLFAERMLTGKKGD